MMSKDGLEEVYGNVSPVEFIRVPGNNCVSRTKDFLDRNILCVLNVSGPLDKCDLLLQELYEQGELAAGEDFDGYISGTYSDDSKNFEATLSLMKRKD